MFCIHNKHTVYHFCGDSQELLYQQITWLSDMLLLVYAPVKFIGFTMIKKKGRPAGTSAEAGFRDTTKEPGYNVPEVVQWVLP